MFGGSTGLNTNATLFGFEAQSNLWELIRVKAADNNAENIPQGSDEHTAVVHEDNMYIFGGFIDGDRVDCVYRFNFKSGEWQQLLTAAGEAKPSARAGHTSVVAKDETGAYMYVFGGKDNEDNKLNDLWRLNLETEKWEVVKPDESQI